MNPPDRLGACTGFDRDQASAEESRGSHRVTFRETGDIFFNDPLLHRPDATQSRGEVRHMAFGTTDAGRLLFLSFTIRRHLIRVISARGKAREEANTYARLEA